MVSLLKLAQITEEGVRFLSPHDGSPMFAVPSEVICDDPTDGDQAVDPGAFYIPSKFYWLRHHNAARRCHCYDVVGLCSDGRGYEALCSMAGQMHCCAQISRKTELVLHHPRRFGPRYAEKVL